MYRIAVLFTDKTVATCLIAPREGNDLEDVSHAIKVTLEFHKGKEILMIQITKDIEKTIWVDWV